jgi:hypothetical protein
MKKLITKKVLAKKGPAVIPATILYRRMPGDMILIVGFENFLSAEELKSKYGETITEIYLSYQNHLERKSYTDGSIYIQILEGMEAFFDRLDIGDLLPRKVFSNIVADVKKAGSLLHEVILAQGNDIRRIEI